MENSGWVKLHRKLLENPVSKRPLYLSLWIHILLLANHRSSTFIWNDKRQTLQPGQLLTGRKELAEQTCISESQVYRILKYLENEQQIEQQKTTKFTIITVINWARYQKKEQQNEQQKDNRRTHTRMYKNEKKERDINKEKENGKDYGEELREMFASKGLIMTEQGE